MEKIYATDNWPSILAVGVGLAVLVAQIIVANSHDEKAVSRKARRKRRIIRSSPTTSDDDEAEQRYQTAHHRGVSDAPLFASIPSRNSDIYDTWSNSFSKSRSIATGNATNSYSNLLRVYSSVGAGRAESIPTQPRRPEPALNLSRHAKFTPQVTQHSNVSSKLPFSPEPVQSQRSRPSSNSHPGTMTPQHHHHHPSSAPVSTLTPQHQHHYPSPAPVSTSSHANGPVGFRPPALNTESSSISGFAAHGVAPLPFRKPSAPAAVTPQQSFAYPPAPRASSFSVPCSPRIRTRNQPVGVNCIGVGSSGFKPNLRNQQDSSRFSSAQLKPPTAAHTYPSTNSYASASLSNSIAISSTTINATAVNIRSTPPSPLLPPRCPRPSFASTVFAVTTSSSTFSSRAFSSALSCGTDSAIVQPSQSPRTQGPAGVRRPSSFANMPQQQSILTRSPAPALPLPGNLQSAHAALRSRHTSPVVGALSSRQQPSPLHQIDHSRSPSPYIGNNNVTTSGNGTH